MGVGLDPGDEVKIARALSEEGVLGDGDGGGMRFTVCGAEECARGVRDVSSTFKKGVDDGEDGEGVIYYSCYGGIIPFTLPEPCFGYVEIATKV